MKKHKNSLFRLLTYTLAVIFGILLFEGNTLPAYATENPQYVIDYALPVEINLSEYIGGKRPVSGTSTYGNVTTNGSSIIYTPTQIINGIDTLDIRLNDGSTFNLDIVPASSVYYEEAFLLSDTDTSTITGTTSIDAYRPERQTVTKVGEKAIYGYDEKYAKETEGYSNQTEAYIDTKQTISLPFSGTGIEIRTGIMPESGWVMFALYKQNDDGSLGERVTASLIYLRSGNGTTWYTSLQSAGGRGLPFIARDLPYEKYVLQITTLSSSYVHIDGFRIFGALGDNGDAIYAKDNQANPQYYSIRENVLTQAINSYDSISDAINDDLKKVVDDTVNNYTKGIVLIALDGGVTAEDLEDIRLNGPKSEFFLMPGQSIMFKVDGFAAIGMNAYNKPATYELNNEGEKTMVSDLNMYYELKSGVNTITNTSKDTILALTDIRITEGEYGRGEGVIDMNADDIKNGLEQMLELDIKGSVSWSAPASLLATRPNSVKIILNSSSENNIDSVELIEGDYAFTDLPKYDDDLNYISYSITPQDVNGFNLSVNNYDIQYSGDINDSEITNPNTADKAAAVIVVNIILGGIAAITCLVLVKRR